MTGRNDLVTIITVLFRGLIIIISIQTAEVGQPAFLPCVLLFKLAALWICFPAARQMLSVFSQSY